jgi:hypothetical protein
MSKNRIFYFSEIGITDTVKAMLIDRWYHINYVLNQHCIILYSIYSFVNPIFNCHES